VDGGGRNTIDGDNDDGGDNDGGGDGVASDDHHPTPTSPPDLEVFIHLLDVI